MQESRLNINPVTDKLSAASRLEFIAPFFLCLDAKVTRAEDWTSVYNMDLEKDKISI